jgi:hypothetical protein
VINPFAPIVAPDPTETAASPEDTAFGTIDIKAKDANKVANLLNQAALLTTAFVQTTSALHSATLAALNLPEPTDAENTQLIHAILFSTIDALSEYVDADNPTKDIDPPLVVIATNAMLSAYAGIILSDKQDKEKAA